MYKLILGRNNQNCGVTLQVNNMLYSIPFDPANTDYAEFKKAVTEGAELEDADGNVMSPEAAQEFIRTLP
jgi:uncharacterized protein YjbI with pentapeptide repeats